MCAFEVEGFQFEPRLAGPPDPGTLGLAHHGLERCDQTTGRTPPSAVVITVHREAVGYDDEISLRHASSFTMADAGTSRLIASPG